MTKPNHTRKSESHKNTPLPGLRQPQFAFIQAFVGESENHLEQEPIPSPQADYLVGIAKKAVRNG